MCLNQRKILVGVMIPLLGLSSAMAGSFYIPQQSAGSVGRAFIGGTTLAQDASTIFSNPAGMGKLEHAEAQAGTSILIVDLDFENKGSAASTLLTDGDPVAIPGSSVPNPYDPTFVPHLYLAAPIAKKKAWIGLGITAPFGLATEYADGWFGRYDTITTSLRTVNIGPAIAFRLNDNLFVGLGVDVQYADAELSQALPDPINPGGPTVDTDGRSDLSGDGFDVGFNAGLLIEPLPGTRFGLHYRSGIHHTLDGQLKLQAPVGLGAGSQSIPATTEFDLPDIVSLGIAYEVTPRLTVTFGAQWFNWSRFDEIRIHLDEGLPDEVREEGYRDAYAIGLAVDFIQNDRWSFQGGILFDQTPTQDEFRNTSIPDADRYWIDVGTQYRLGDSFRVTASYARTIFKESQVDITRSFFDGAAVAQISGRSQYAGDTLSLSLSCAF
jgi:long-chain fatty acid transport protein